MSQLTLFSIIIGVWIAASYILEKRKQKIIHNFIINSRSSINELKLLDKKFENKFKKTFSTLYRHATSENGDISSYIQVSEHFVYSSKLVKTFYDPFRGVTCTTESNIASVTTPTEIELDNLLEFVNKKTTSQALVEQKIEDFYRDKPRLRLVKTAA